MKLPCMCFVFLWAALGVQFTQAMEISIQGLPPVVVKTIPESGSTDVDPRQLKSGLHPAKKCSIIVGPFQSLQNHRFGGHLENTCFAYPF